MRVGGGVKNDTIKEDEHKMDTRVEKEREREREREGGREGQRQKERVGGG